MCETEDDEVRTVTEQREHCAQGRSHYYISGHDRCYVTRVAIDKITVRNIQSQ